MPAPGLRLAARINVFLAGLFSYEPELTPEGAAIISARARMVSDRAKRELGYESPPLRPLVEESYGWLKQQGLVPR